MSVQSVDTPGPIERDPVTLEDLATQLSRIEGEVSRILSFAETLAGMLDAMGQSPVLAAMLPPGMFPPGD